MKPKAARVVQALASCSPVFASEVHGDPECALCDADLFLSPDVHDPTNHEPTCPWRLAKEWLEGDST